MRLILSGSVILSVPFEIIVVVLSYVEKSQPLENYPMVEISTTSVAVESTSGDLVLRGERYCRFLVTCRYHCCTHNSDGSCLFAVWWSLVHYVDFD